MGWRSVVTETLYKGNIKHNGTGDKHYKFIPKQKITLKRPKRLRNKKKRFGSELNTQRFGSEFKWSEVLAILNWPDTWNYLY